MLEIKQSPQYQNTPPNQSNDYSSTNKLKFALVSTIFLLIGAIIGYVLGSKNQQTPQSFYTQSISSTPTSSAFQKTIPNLPLSTSVLNNKSNCQLEGYNGQPIGNIVNDSSCKVSVPIEENLSYEVTYPRTWTVRLAGAGGVNLYFNETKNEQLMFSSPKGVFLEVDVAELPLEESYKAVSRFEQAVDPIVVEPIKNHMLKQANNKETLVVITADAQRSYQYQMFQLVGKQYKWLFTIKTLEGVSDSSFLSELDQMINSIRLVIGGFPQASP